MPDRFVQNCTLRGGAILLKLRAPWDARHALVTDPMAFRPCCPGDGSSGALPCGGRNKARNPSLTSRTSATPAAMCAPAQRTLADIAQFHPLEVNMALTNFKLLICLVILSDSTLAQAECLRTVSDIKASSVKAKWQETTENDGKPLTISITDGANGLVYSASKAGLPWLTRNVSVCRSGGATGDYVEKYQSHEQCPDACKAGLTSHAVGPHC